MWRAPKPDVVLQNSSVSLGHEWPERGCGCCPVAAINGRRTGGRGLKAPRDRSPAIMWLGSHARAGLAALLGVYAHPPAVPQPVMAGTVTHC